MKPNHKAALKLSILILWIIATVSVANSQSGWYRLNNVYSQLKAVHFLNKDTGFIGGDGNTLWRTNNSGSSWQNIYPPGVLSHVSGFAFTDDSNGWFCSGIVGNNSYRYYVFRTFDGGNSWVRIYESDFVNSSFFYFPTAIEFIDSNVGIMTFWGNRLEEQRGKILKSTDGGYSWFRVDSSIACYGVSAVNNKVAVAGFYRNPLFSDTGFVKTSTDWGSTWTKSLTVWGGCFSIDATDENTIHAAGFYLDTSQVAVVYKSTDFGNTWTINYSRRYRYFLGIDMVDSDYGWAVGNAGLISKTTNSGLTWNTQATPIPEQLNAIFMVDRNLGFSVGQNAYALKTTTGGELNSSVFESSHSVEDYYLNQNFPNPFNPSTEIRFNLKKTLFVRLRITDVSGKHIAMLVNKELSYGDYSINFDGTGLSSGIYFYILETENSSEARKMLLLK
jgi:photosystem II stability/assembly factor-like uncharacterized protein